MWLWVNNHLAALTTGYLKGNKKIYENSRAGLMSLYQIWFSRRESNISLAELWSLPFFSIRDYNWLCFSYWLLLLLRKVIFLTTKLNIQPQNQFIDPDKYRGLYIRTNKTKSKRNIWKNELEIEWLTLWTQPLWCEWLPLLIRSYSIKEWKLTNSQETLGYWKGFVIQTWEQSKCQVNALHLVSAGKVCRAGVGAVHCIFSV